MRRLRVIEFLTLDGVMQGPGHAEEDTEDGFRHGGWEHDYFDEVLMKGAAAGMAETSAYLFGRKTYEVMAAYWPTAPADDPFSGSLNGTPKYVASRTLAQDDLTWDGTTLLAGDVPTAVAGLRERGEGAIAVLGSGALVETLAEHDLVDEYSLMVVPLLLGSGKRLFRPAERVRKLELAEATTTTTGTVVLTYRPVRGA